MYIHVHAKFNGKPTKYKPLSNLLSQVRPCLSPIKSCQLTPRSVGLRVALMRKTMAEYL